MGSKEGGHRKELNCSTYLQRLLVCVRLRALVLQNNGDAKKGEPVSLHEVIVAVVADAHIGFEILVRDGDVDPPRGAAVTVHAAARAAVML